MRRVDDRLTWAEAKLADCRRIALRYFGTALRITTKPDRSPVTIADRTIEERLRKELARAFPGDAIVGEEFGSPAALGSTYWTIDPIDGTRPFSRGLPTWGILLGRVEQGRPVFGACLYPALDIFVGVAPGTPAYERRDGRRIALPRASAPPRLAGSTIFHGGSAWWLRSRYAKGFTRLVQACYLERVYGDCYAYLWLLRGRADAVVEYGVKIWDLVPFAALARATGRVMTDCADRHTFTGPESILAHPRLARSITSILRSSRA